MQPREESIKHRTEKTLEGRRGARGGGGGGGYGLTEERDTSVGGSERVQHEDTGGACIHL